MDHGLLDGVLALLAFAVAGVALLRRLGLPPILGYLAVGVLAGPHALGWLPQDQAVRLVAEVGLIFLLFSIGLELSLGQLLAMRGPVLGLGGGQVALSLLGGMALGPLLGLGRGASLVLGAAVAMSSTAIVLKQLHDQAELRSRHGRIAFGVLLFQDLAVVPLLVVIPILAQGDAGMLGPALALALGKAAVAVVAVYLAGHWVLRPALHQVARVRSGELFTLAVLLMALSAAWATASLGLSLALGAFLAGMALSETEYRHQIEAAIRPFRDVLMGLFFIAVGQQLDPAVLPRAWGHILLVLAALVAGKALVVFALARIGGQHAAVAMRAALALAQGGEFGFAVIAIALAQGVVSVEEMQPALAAVVLSMFLAPLLLRYNGRLAKRLFGDRYLHERFEQVMRLTHATREQRDHVIVCGYGRIGQNLASFLRNAGFGHVALDLDPVLVREARQAGENVFYGDATHVDLLIAAGLNRARALVVTVENPAVDERIVAAAHRQRPDLPILVRIRDERRYDALERAGASDVVPDAVESSLTLAAYLLPRLGVPTDELLTLVERARADHFRELRGVFLGEVPADTEAPLRYGLRTVMLAPGSWAAGRRLEELGLEGMGVMAKAIRRGMVRGEAPEPGTVLRPGDAVILEGRTEALAQAERRMIHG